MKGIKRKMDLAGFVSMLLGLVSSSTNVKEFQQSGGPGKLIHNPAYCNNLNCPDFYLLETIRNRTEGSVIELREYEQVEWVSTMKKVAKMDDIDRVTSPMFMKLFDYISGDNAAAEKIKMTCPVRMGIYPGQGPACSSNVTMSFYLTSKSSPKPSGEGVYLDSTTPHQYYVISFGGRPDFDEKQKKAEELANFLKNKGITDFVQEPWYTAGYDSPFRFFNRHNEVWLMRKQPRMIKIQ